MLILLAFFYSIANLMTEFSLVAENVTETEDADLYCILVGIFFLFQIMQIGPGLILCNLHSQGLSRQLNSLSCLFWFDWNSHMCSSSKYFCGFFFPLRNVIDTLMVYSDEVLSQVSSVYRVPICPFLAVCLWRLHS
jgi:hypothetical protein